LSRIFQSSATARTYRHKQNKDGSNKTSLLLVVKDRQNDALLIFFRAAIKGKQYGRPEDGQIEPPTSNQTRHDTGRRGRMEMGPRLRYKTVGRGCEPARKGRGGTVHNTRHTRGSHTQASRTLSRASHRDGPEGYRSHASTQSLALLRHPYAEDSLGLQGVRARNLTRENQTSVPTPQRTRTEQRGREKRKQE